MPRHEPRWAFALLLVSLVRLPAAGPVAFQSAPVFSLGYDPASVVLADVNGDGRNDLLAGGAQLVGLSVLMATNNGYFMPAYTNHVPGVVNGVTKVGAADFDGDGHQDALVLGILLQQMSGNGAGGFTLVSSLNPLIPTTGGRQGCTEFAIADFNTDGIPDIAATFWGTHMQLLKGTGAGTFTVSADIPVVPVRMFVEDFTGDGKLDIFYTVSIGSPGLLAGRGDGTFDAPVTVTVNFGGGAMAADDFNGDGWIDMAVTAANSTINVFPGAAGGTFLAPVPFPVRRFPIEVAAGDLDGDGLADLAVASRDEGLVTVYRGTATGYLTSPVHWSAHTLLKLVRVGDVTADGVLDVLAATQTTKELALLRGVGAGRFFAPASWTVGSIAQGLSSVDSLASTDLDADGHPDVAVVTGSTTTTVLWGDGGGGFGGRQELGGFPGGTGNPTSVAFADVNGDQLPDVGVTATYSKLAIYLNTGGRSFSGPTLFSTGQSTTSPAYVHFADINLDLKIDAVILNRWGVGGLTSWAAILGGLGNGQFNAPVEVALSNVGQGGVMLNTANIGGLARPEIFFPSSSGTVLFYSDNNTNAWTEPGNWKQYATPAIHWLSSLDLVDVDRDGRLDYAFTDPTNNWVSVSRGLAAAGQFATQVDYPVAGAPRWLRSKDVNGDGMPDLVACNSQTNLVTVLTNNHSGGFSAAAYFRIGPFARPYNLLVTDLNHDLKPDVLTANGTNNTVTVVLNATDLGPLPVLAITMAPPNAIVSWPAAGGDFRLQYSSSLAANAAWSTPLRYSPVGGVYQFTNAIPAAGSRYFRLQPVP